MSADTPDTAETLARKIAEALDPNAIARWTYDTRKAGQAREAERILPLIRDAFREREQEVARLRDENAQWRTWGIIEVAIRNPNVSSYMSHWEGRAIAAESALAEAKGLLITAELHLREHWVGKDIRAFLARPEGKPAEPIKCGTIPHLHGVQGECIPGSATAPAVEGPQTSVQHRWEMGRHPLRCGYYLGGDPGESWAYCGKPASDPIHAQEEGYCESMTVEGVCKRCNSHARRDGGAYHPIHAPEPAAEPPKEARFCGGCKHGWSFHDGAGTVHPCRVCRCTNWVASGPYVENGVLILGQRPPAPTPERAPARTTCSDCGNVLTVGERATGLCVHCAPDPVAAPAKAQVGSGQWLPPLR